jgi:hypothetical protein
MMFILHTGSKRDQIYHTSISVRASSRLGIGATVDPNKVSQDQLVWEGWASEILLMLAMLPYIWNDVYSSCFSY